MVNLKTKTKKKKGITKKRETVIQYDETCMESQGAETKDKSTSQSSN